MLLFHALKNKSIRWLWLGQVTSTVGNEIYRVAFVWLAISWVGSDIGYFTSLEQLAVLAFGVLGARYLDRRESDQLLIEIDIIRAFIALVPVALFYSHINSFPILVLSSVFLAGFGAWFEPSMQSMLTVLSTDHKTIKAANGLMSTTFRLARVMGPALIGILSVWMSTIHFFSLNALSFVFSAISIHFARKNFKFKVSHTVDTASHWFAVFKKDFKMLRSKPAVYRALMAKCYAGGGWGLAYGIGLAMLVHEQFPKNLKAFGVVMGSYGVGNVLSALWFGSRERKNPEKMVYSGLIYLGICFLAVSVANTYFLLALFTALAAIGGPWNDLPFVDLVQEKCSFREISTVFRLRAIIDNFCILITMSLSPLLFKVFSVRVVIALCGGLMLGAGLSAARSMKRQ